MIQPFARPSSLLAALGTAPVLRLAALGVAPAFLVACGGGGGGGGDPDPFVDGGVIVGDDEGPGTAPSGIPGDRVLPIAGDFVLDGCDEPIVIDTEFGAVLCGGMPLENVPDTTLVTAPKIGEFEHPGLAVFAADSFRVNTNIVVNVVGPRPLVIVSLGPVQIDGTMNVIAGGWPIRDKDGTRIDPTSGPGGGTPDTPDNNNAAGGGSHCGKGGSGGVASLAIPALEGGPTYGDDTAVPLVGGSAGGTDETGLGSNPGGGAIQIYSATSLTVGTNGRIVVAAVEPTFGSRVGGGAGGSVLLEAPELTIAGTLIADGGKPSTSVETKGGAGTVVNGENGVDDLAGSIPYGGGGGAGRIRLNSKAGAATVTGTVSPALTTTCGTEGKTRKGLLEPVVPADE